MRASFRNRLVFVQQQKIDVYNPQVEHITSAENIIWRTDDLAKKWIEQATERIGDYRSFVRSVYIRWAININALHIAERRYRENSDIALAVDTLRPSHTGPEKVHMVVWPANQAADNYAASIPLMAAYAVQDLYGALEEIIFALYEIFLNAHPGRLMEGKEYKGLRKLYRERDSSAKNQQAFDSAWSERIDAWRRKRAYDGLHKVFASFWSAAGLHRPSWFKHSDIAEWCRTIETVAEIRHLIVHGENDVSTRLADLCQAQPELGFKFQAGNQLEVKLLDLMIVENFLDTLLTAINSSLLEFAIGEPLPNMP